MFARKTKAFLFEEGGTAQAVTEGAARGQVCARVSLMRPVRLEHARPNGLSDAAAPCRFAVNNMQIYGAKQRVQNLGKTRIPSLCDVKSDKKRVFARKFAK